MPGFGQTSQCTCTRNEAMKNKSRAHKCYVQENVHKGRNRSSNLLFSNPKQIHYRNFLTCSTENTGIIKNLLISINQFKFLQRVNCYFMQIKISSSREVRTSEAKNRVILCHVPFYLLIFANRTLIHIK